MSRAGYLGLDVPYRQDTVASAIDEIHKSCLAKDIHSSLHHTDSPSGRDFHPCDILVNLDTPVQLPTENEYPHSRPQDQTRQFQNLAANHQAVEIQMSDSGLTESRSQASTVIDICRI